MASLPSVPSSRLSLSSSLIPEAELFPTSRLLLSEHLLLSNAGSHSAGLAALPSHVVDLQLQLPWLFHSLSVFWFRTVRGASHLVWLTISNNQVTGRPMG